MCLWIQILRCIILFLRLILLCSKAALSKCFKSFFKLKKDFISMNPDIKTTIHIFDHTIKPILLYGAEIWGYFNPFAKKITSLVVRLTKFIPIHYVINCILSFANPYLVCINLQQILLFYLNWEDFPYTLIS